MQKGSLISIHENNSLIHWICLRLPENLFTAAAATAAAAAAAERQRRGEKRKLMQMLMTSSDMSHRALQKPVRIKSSLRAMRSAHRASSSWMLMRAETCAPFSCECASITSACLIYIFYDSLLGKGERERERKKLMRAVLQIGHKTERERDSYFRRTYFAFKYTRKRSDEKISFAPP